MIKFIKELFVGKKEEKTPELVDIINSFEQKVAQLDKRSSEDANTILVNDLEITKLQDVNKAKAADIERANRIKSKIEQMIS